MWLETRLTLNSWFQCYVFLNNKCRVSRYQHFPFVLQQLEIFVWRNRHICFQCSGFKFLALVKRFSIFPVGVCYSFVWSVSSGVLQGFIGICITSNRSFTFSQLFQSLFFFSLTYSPAIDCFLLFHCKHDDRDREILFLLFS